jgi:hypothetical protein
VAEKVRFQNERDFGFDTRLQHGARRHGCAIVEDHVGE